MTTQLTAQRQDDSLAITGPGPNTGLPTIVLWLGPTLTVEIDPSREAPVRIDTDDYARDRGTLALLLAPETVHKLDTAADGHSVPLGFTPGPEWPKVHALAARQWNLEWSPLPHDPALLALDLVAAKHVVAHLTNDTPSPALLDAAYPAAQALQRLLDTGGLSAEARAEVEASLQALEACTPLNYTPPQRPYTLPMPLTREEIREILDPPPEDPDAILIGSPDWRLVGNGPAATAENTIIVTHHPSRPGAVTITVPAQPHTDPSTVPSYQAFITDPQTHNTIAAATIAYSPATKTYTGNSLPRRPLTASDLIDIRHASIATAPLSDSRNRKAAYRTRTAVRAYAAALPAPLGSLADLAQKNQILIKAEGVSQADLELWLMLEVASPTGLRSGAAAGSSVGKLMKLSTKIPQLNAEVTIIGALGRAWQLRLAAAQPLGRVSIRIRWQSGQVTSAQIEHDPLSTRLITLAEPQPGDTPVSVRVEPS